MVTRQTDWQAEGAVVAHSIEEAMGHCPADAEVWVIGGAEVYAQAMPLATRAVVTEIDADFEGDAFAPSFDATWQEITRSTHVAANGLTYSLVTLTRTH